MTEPAVRRSWFRLSMRAWIAVAIALVVGGVAGLLVNVVWPNPVYGFQLIADLLVIFVAVVVAAIPILRRFLPMALGLAVGVIAGVAIGMNLVRGPDASVSAIVDLQLGKPVIANLTTISGNCWLTDGALELLQTPDDGGLVLPDGRRLSMSIGEGVQEPVAGGRALDLVVTVSGTFADGSPTSTVMASDASSTVSITSAGAAGSISFSGLVLHDQSELREPIDIAGTITWTCGS